MGRLFALAMTLAAAVLIAWLGATTPAPAPVTAPARAFSATRAMLDVQAIGQVPHPVGSPAHDAARDYLLGRMRAAGLSPAVHAGIAFETLGRPGSMVVAGGRVENLLGVLPGRDRAAPAIVLMAHYDSVPGSPAAGDDAAGVASVLEVARALKAMGTPARDVMVLITDGEEAGLLGARAFFARDPMARRAGFILNLETRGGGGRVQMFQTTGRSGGAIAILGWVAPDPHASSLSSYFYERMPNDTDFTVSKAAGLDGLNFAFIGRQFDYHSPTAIPAYLDRGSLQDMGQQALAVARAVAFAPALPARTANPVYSQTLGGLMIAYPPAFGWAPIAVAAALLLFALIRARRREAVPWSDLARGAGAALFAALGAAAVLRLARIATGAGFGFLEQRFLLAQPIRWEIAVILLGLGFLILAAAELARGRRAVAAVPLLAGVGSCLLGGFDKLGLGLGGAAAILALAAYGRPVSRAGAWAGVLLLGLAVATALQAMAPPTAYLAAWPLLLACLAAAASALSLRRGPGALGAVGLLAALGLGWMGGLAHDAFLGLDMVEILAALTLPAGALLWPLAQPDEGAPPARLVGPLLMLAGAAALLAIRYGHPYDSRHPHAAYVAFEADQDRNAAWRVARAGGPGWTDKVLRAEGGTITRASRWWTSGTLAVAAAAKVQRPAPVITLTPGLAGLETLHAAAPPGARTLTVKLSPTVPITLERFAGLPAGVLLKPGDATVIRWLTAAESLDLVLRPAGSGVLDLAYAATVDRWPPEAPPLPARPADVMEFGDSGGTVITGSRRLAW